MKIEFLKPKFPKLSFLKNRIAGSYKKCIFSNNGPIVQSLEQKMKESFLFDGEVVLCANGTIALMVALKVLGGKKAAVPAFTFPATISSLNWAGIDYTYVDVNQDDWTMNVEHLEKVVQEDDVDIVLPVHSFGNPCDVLSIDRICKINNCKLVYDAAPAIASFVNLNDKNIHISNFGDIACFSMHATKALPAAEGGALFIKDKDVAETVRSMINFGFAQGCRYPLMEYGFNGKISEIHAAIAIESMVSLAANQKQRIDLVNRYKKNLNGIVDFQVIKGDNISTHQVLSVCLKDEDLVIKDSILNDMKEDGIEVRNYYNPPLHQTEVFRKNVSLPVTEDICSRVLTLPLHLYMDQKDVDYVCSKFIESYENFGGKYAKHTII